MRNVIAFANGKGGVGKTSFTANFAGLAAAAGWRVLAVDLDPQGNLGADLGYEQAGKGDDGAHLMKALIHGSTPIPMPSVRANLDVLSGGFQLDGLVELLAHRAGGERLRTIRKPLSQLAPEYDLVVMDCPPIGGMVLQSMLAAASFVVVPTRRDLASMQGLTRVAREFSVARSEVNPQLSLLGVALFDFATQDTRMLAEVRALLEMRLGEIAPVFEGHIRQARRGSTEMRRLGMLAHEYLEATQSSGGPRQSGSVAGVAEDYRMLTAQILEEYLRRVEPEDVSEGSAA